MLPAVESKIMLDVLPVTVHLDINFVTLWVNRFELSHLNKQGGLLCYCVIKLKR